MSVTFPVSKVKINNETLRTTETRSAIANLLNKQRPEAWGTNTTLPLLIDYSGSKNGLINTLHVSYALHLNLELSPDDIWMAVAQGFANHVDVNAEKLRKQFVAHEGKVEIVISRDGFTKGSPDNDWMGGFSEFSDKIAEHIGKKRDLLVSDFSTTGGIEKAASEVVLMNAMKHYFSYGCTTCCGIPQITLRGKEADWLSIVERAQTLAEFDCKGWIDALIPNLKLFSLAFKGSADPKQWEALYKEPGGSGGPFINGWVNTLFPYLQKAKGLIVNPSLDSRIMHGPKPENFPNGLSSVPFTWYYHGAELPMQFAGGFVGTSQNEGSVSPAIGWAVADAVAV